ncbi:MAG: DUF484 family protein [Neisseria sp.]|nr:DUF484 family protein [Neisseria sp.]
MKKANVLRFLHDNPDFLAEHADELGIRLRESKMRTFSEAKLAAADRKIDTIARHMADMTENAEHNHAMLDKLTRLNLSLMACNTLQQVDTALRDSLNADFVLPHFDWFLLQTPAKKLRMPASLMLPENHAARGALRKLHAPQCDTRLLHKSLEKRLPENAESESFLHLPLRFHDTTLGVLLIGHPDPNYFAPDAPTTYVAMMGAALGATLARIMGLRAA